MKKLFLSLTILSLVFLPQALGFSNQAMAQTSNAVNQAQQQLKDAAIKSGINTAGTIDAQIAQIVKLVLGFLGVIFLILIIMAGFKWMTAGGAGNQVKEAQTSLTNATIGLAIILFSYLITNYVVFSLFDILAKNK